MPSLRILSTPGASLIILTMIRHQARCRHCGQASGWRREPEEGRQEMRRHLAETHGISEDREPPDYQLVAERQCDYCLEPYLDDCTKCRHDFCQFHAGDIDGLCGGCI